MKNKLKILIVVLTTTMLMFSCKKEDVQPNEKLSVYGVSADTSDAGSLYINNVYVGKGIPYDSILTSVGKEKWNYACHMNDTIDFYIHSKTSIQGNSWIEVTGSTYRSGTVYGNDCGHGATDCHINYIIK